jgi:hypothetical protein
MTSKFEQLIEYVINDEEAKAKELFHDIVVEKSREIYENLMNEEEQDSEAEDAEEDAEQEEAEEIGETFGGDAAGKLIRDVETEEQGMSEEESDAEFDDEAEEEGEDLTKDMEADYDQGEGDIEDRVVDLEDKLDELMAEFESLMGNESGEEHSEIDVELEPGEGGDALEMDDTEEFQDEPAMMEEAVNLSAAPKPVTSEEGNVNKKSTVAFNSGAAGMEGKPVKTGADNPEGKHDAPGAYSNQPKELIGKVQNSVGGKKTMNPAPKPVTSQASGVNTKTPFPKA